MRKKKASPKRRSGCPLNASVEILGDRWSFPIICDMMLRGFRTCQEFLARIATNILTDRCGNWKLLESSPPSEIDRMGEG